MGYNTKQFDKESHYASKSTTELQTLIKQAENFVVEYPQFAHGWHNEYIQMLKLLFAERIGNKNRL